jgi:hypothetical protein
MKTNLPDHSLVRAILPFGLLMLLLAVASPASQLLRYREQTGESSFTFLWRSEQDRTGVTITQDQGDETYSSVCTPEGTTLSWRYLRRPDTDIRAERIGDRIQLSGRLDGKVIDQSRTIDGRPWFQPLSFSLQRMVARDAQTATFWTIRPDTLEIIAMKAEKFGSEQLPRGDFGQTADKVVIRLDGLLSGVWHADYWFRQSDNLFVGYRGTHGPPGTPETSIHLITP